MNLTEILIQSKKFDKKYIYKKIGTKFLLELNKKRLGD